jgi:hypothetical protein
MGFLLYQLSSINVVNGLNFKREQLLKLREIAQELASERLWGPRIEGTFDRDYGKVREEFLRTREFLLSGKTVTKEIQERVAKARRIESAAIKAGLTWNPGAKYASCARCHSERKAGSTARALGRRWGGLPAWTAKEKALAHILGAFDPSCAGRALAKLQKASGRIDAVLTDEQKEVFRDFSCCLLPPTNLGDPVRVGQAAVADWQIKLLDSVRTKSRAAWPLTKLAIQRFFVQQALMVKPGLTEKEKGEIRHRVGEILEKARSLPKLEYEMEKESLAAQFKGPGLPETPENLQPFMRAFFLMIPGAVEVYDTVIARLDRGETQRPKPRDLEKEKPAAPGG